MFFVVVSLIGLGMVSVVDFGVDIVLVVMILSVMVISVVLLIVVL